jgi:iron complex outermembrane recepter protein
VRQIFQGLASSMVSIAAVTAASYAPIAISQTDEKSDLHIDAQDLAASLQALATATGREILFRSESVAGKTAPALEGRFSPAEALTILLKESGLHYRENGKSFVIVGRSEASTALGDGADDAHTVFVTGSRIRGADAPGSSVIRIDRKAIGESGYASAQQILQSIPQAYGGGANETTSGATGASGANLNSSYGSSINLRGLGPASTLVLLNGNRPALGGSGGVFADISMLPVSAIERIEVLPDGASAIYGSDAVAGVVNLITRRDFEGAETALRYGTADGDFSEIQASQIVGTRWGSGRAVLAVEYYRRGNLAAADRDYATQDLRRWGGSDYRAQFANPGNIVAGGQTYAIPAGQDGRSLVASDLVADTLNRQDGWEQADLLPRQTRYSAYGRVEQDVTDRLTVDIEGLYARRTFSRRVNPAGYQSSVTITPDNPYYVDPIGTGRAISVRYDFTDELGPRTDQGKVEGLGFNAGGTLRLGGWSIDLRGTYGQQTENFGTINLPNTARLAVAGASSDPAIALNLFGDGQNNSASVLDYIRGSTHSRFRSTIWSGAVRGDGPLINLPGGQARLALGAEHRDERFTSRTLSDQSRLEPFISTSGTQGARNIEAVYGELFVPIVGEENALPAIRSLSVSAAVRHEKYNDFGTTTNPKFGLSWKPVTGLELKGSFGTSFRAPGFVELRQTPDSDVFFIYPVSDPLSPTGTSNVMYYRGNKTGMQPEKARTFTMGFVLEPAMLPGLRLSSTYFDIRYKDQIVDLTSALLQMLNNRATYAALINDNPSLEMLQTYINSPNFIDYFGLKAADVDIFIDARTQNLAVTRQKGIDFEAQYRFPAGGGEARIGFDGTYLFRFTRAASASAPAIDILNSINNPVDLRLRGHGGWTSGSFSALASVNYVRGYENTIVSPAEHVDAWTTVDAQIGYRFEAKGGALHGVSLALSATNLFDKDPPYAAFSFNGITAVGYDPQNANPLGRVVSLQLTKAW